MLEIAELLKRGIAACESLGIPYLVVGSVASSAFGEYRSTNDIDIVIELKAQDVPALCAKFPEPDYYVSEIAAREAVRLERMFNVIENWTGYKIDFAIAQSSPWGRSQLVRRRQVPILPGVVGYIASPEDVIISKMRYHQDGESDKHLRDIAAVLRVSGDSLDYEYIKRWTLSLQLTNVWQAVQRRLAEPRAGESTG